MAVDDCVTEGYPSAGELCATISGLDLDRARALLALAEALIEEYAPGAPAAVKREAAIRVCGYVWDRKPGIRREATTIGDYTRSATYEMSTGALRASGAMSLLSRWKTRRAGVI